MRSQQPSRPPPSSTRPRCPHRPRTCGRQRHPLRAARHRAGTPITSPAFGIGADGTARPAAHPAGRWPQTLQNGAAQRMELPRSEPTECLVPRDRRRAPAAAAARCATEVPRVLRPAVDRIRRLPVGQHRRHVGLAQEHGAGRAQPRPGRCVVLRDEVPPLRHAARGAQPAHVERLLQRDWKPAERSIPATVRPAQPARAINHGRPPRSPDRASDAADVPRSARSESPGLRGDGQQSAAVANGFIHHLARRRLAASAVPQAIGFIERQRERFSLRLKLRAATALPGRQRAVIRWPAGRATQKRRPGDPG
jgi:hypothetical protein